jgi:hypothetical protein
MAVQTIGEAGMTQVDAPSRLQEAVTRIENRLLHSGIQIDGGTHRGDGSPEFVHLETAGYYLTAMAWLASGAAYSSDHVQTANLRASRVADWVTTFLASRDHPPTRLSLSAKRADWRKEPVFSFDLAMAARGLAATVHPGDRCERRQALAALCAKIGQISSGAEVMKSHEFAPGCASTMTHRWSTRPGPHHLKAAAAILALPDRIAGGALISVARETCEYWTHALWTNSCPSKDLQALLYGLEGMIILAAKRDGQGLRLVERPFARLMEEAQAPDGTLPEMVHGGIVRSDVLAQALRIGLLLRGRGFLTESIWRDRLDRLTDALLDLVRPDGAVIFSHDQAIVDTRSTLFALQALYLSARKDMQEPAPTAGFQLLV